MGLQSQEKRPQKFCRFDKGKTVALKFGAANSKGPEMQTDNPFIDDLSKLANGLVSTLDSMKKECDAMVRARIERLAGEFDRVPRDEFEGLKEMLLKMRAENESLKKRIAALEKTPKSRARKNLSTKKS